MARVSEAGDLDNSHSPQLPWITATHSMWGYLEIHLETDIVSSADTHMVVDENHIMLVLGGSLY